MLPLLREAKRRGFNTAVETTGNVPTATIRQVEPYIDHFLYDFKHIDDDALRCVVGGNGPLVKANLRYLLAGGPSGLEGAERVNVHIPVIPGFNYDPATLRAMLDYLAAEGCRKVNLLPYHTLGKGKYEKMGRAYACPEHALTDADVEPYHRYALKLGMESKIGA